MTSTELSSGWETMEMVRLTSWFRLLPRSQWDRQTYDEDNRPKRESNWPRDSDTEQPMARNGAEWVRHSRIVSGNWRIVQDRISRRCGGEVQGRTWCGPVCLTIFLVRVIARPNQRYSIIEQLSIKFPSPSRYISQRSIRLVPTNFENWKFFSWYKSSYSRNMGYLNPFQVGWETTFLQSNFVLNITKCKASVMMMW